MSDDSMALGYALGQDSNGSNNGSGMWGGDGSWIFAFLIIALIFGGNGWGLGQQRRQRCERRRVSGRGYSLRSVQ